MRRRALLAALGTSLAAPAFAQNQRQRWTASGVGASDFVQFATISDNYEIESSRLLLSRSQHPLVRAFAEHMIEAHTKSAAELRALPEAITRTPASLDERHGDMLEALRRAPDVDMLNRLYVQQQIQAHVDAVGAFELYAGSGEVPALKAFAQRQLPELREHLAQARALQAPAPG